MPTNLVIEDDSFTLGVPFAKINTKNRTVQGFATLDNEDQAGEVLDYQASQRAFSKWIGNIREMHEKKAVGKAIDMVEKQYTAEDGNTYDGIWITAKISKGAEDTWQKVLDGTLAGFSVGGAIFEKERSIMKAADGSDRQVWVIKDYALNEVSLVDNPCNQLATVALVKSLDGAITFEDALESEEIDDLEKVAHNPGDTGCIEPEVQAVLDALAAWRDKEITEEDDYDVATVSRMMASIRQYCNTEQSEHQDQAMMDAMQSVTNKSIDNTEKSLEGEGEDMEKSDEALQNKEISDTSVTELLTVEEKSFFQKLAEKILGEKPTTEEVVAKEGDVASDMNKEEVEGLIGGATEELSKSVDTKFDQIGEALTKFTEALEAVAKTADIETLKTDLESKIEELEGRLSTVEESGAMKKSGEETGKEKIEKSAGLWSDSIVPEFLRKQTR